MKIISITLGSLMIVGAVGTHLEMPFFNQQKVAQTEKAQRTIASEKPASLDHQNTYNALVNSQENFKKDELTKLFEKDDLEAFLKLEKNTNNTLKQNPLTLAVIHNSSKIFSYLLNKNIEMVNFDQQDLYGMTAAMYAAKLDRSQMLRAMLKKEHDLTILSAQEKTAYDYAKESRSIASQKVLEAKDAPCNTSCEFLK